MSSDERETIAPKADKIIYLTAEEANEILSQIVRSPESTIKLDFTDLNELNYRPDVDAAMPKQKKRKNTLLKGSTAAQIKQESESWKHVTLTSRFDRLQRLTIFAVVFTLLSLLFNITRKRNNASLISFNKYILHNALLPTETFSMQFQVTTIEYDNITWDTPTEFRIVCVENATILNPSGLVFNNSGSFSFNKSFWRREEHLITKIKHVQGFQRKAYSLVQLYSQVFQHIVFDGLTRIKLSCQWLQKRVDVIIIIMNKLMGELVREICKLDAKRFFILKRTTSFLSICVPFFVSRNELGENPPSIMTSTGSRTHKGKEYLYLARNKGIKRSVVNQKDVLKTISKFWPKIRVVFPTNDWKKDRKIFEKAKVIIGPHGGAFSNMIFAPVNTTIIEFLPVKTLRYHKKEERPCFLKLAYALQFKYYSVESSIPFDFYKPMVVSIPELDKVLNRANVSLHTN